ncbi:hypothetical protein [Mesorhizobium sp. M0633]|uniref:phosphoribosyltransferase-like protein n=1 Tax=Mesorhizobium sp. M0633 TaxID=2956977 RepID=UPI00333C0CD6
MADDMALSLIAEVMDWDDARATSEYGWLRMMSSIKYDGYSDFRAGVRFVESLAVWLKQFTPPDRPTAYDFFKARVVYVSPAELQCLIDIFFPEVVTPALRAAVAAKLAIEPYEVWETQEGADCFKSMLRRTLFVGMSDGSRTDILRRANSGRISTEQVVATLAIDDDKWKDLNKELVKDEGAGAKFERVYLVDDFTASGTTFVRQGDGGWEGKLSKFDKRVKDAREHCGGEFPLVEGYALHIHHYISSDQARTKLDAMLALAMAGWNNRTFGHVIVTEGLRLPASLKLSVPHDGGILDLCDRYHDPALDKRLEKHLKKSGIPSVKLGYAECALPLILDHNTPNNSIPLLWAETPDEGHGKAMRPLFRRRDRHG